MNQEKIGHFIKKLRKNNNLTQQQFAEKLGVTYQAVSKWENGKNIPDISILRQISKDFNVDINSILDGELANKAKKKAIIFKSLLIILPIVLLGIILILLNNNGDDYNFKTLSANCDNFKITGSIAYNNEKSTIYISKIEYCGGNDNAKYSRIESILYESSNNIEKKISEHVTKKDHSSETLEEYLQDLTFYIDNYNSLCKDFLHSEIYLQLNATNQENKVITYKIPLNLEKKCPPK